MAFSSVFNISLASSIGLDMCWCVSNIFLVFQLCEGNFCNYLTSLSWTLSRDCCTESDDRHLILIPGPFLLSLSYTYSYNKESELSIVP